LRRETNKSVLDTDSTFTSDGWFTGNARNREAVFLIIGVQCSLRART